MKLEIGYNHPFEIRKETCVAAGISSFSVLYLSDLHLTRYSGKMIAQITAAIKELDPTIVLFGGDYADSRRGLVHLHELMHSLSHRAHLYAIAGNHDSISGVNRIETIMRNNNVKWIENKSHHLNIAGTRIRIDGNCIAPVNGDCDFSMAALHKPVNAEQLNNYNLAFAGHLHGSQFVFWQKGEGLFPGKLFYRWNILKIQAGKCLYIISKGLGDTLPIRYNCKRDLLFVQVTTNAQTRTP